jgi:VanZ family protein
MVQLFKSIFPCILWTLMVFILLAMNSHNKIDVPGLDKLVHFGLFFFFSFLWGTYLKPKISIDATSFTMFLVIVGSAYGMGMEFYQKYFTNRSFSYWDGLADALGSVAGAWAVKKSPYGNRGRNQN